jgi:hypothetical protein
VKKHQKKRILDLVKTGASVVSDGRGRVALGLVNALDLKGRPELITSEVARVLMAFERDGLLVIEGTPPHYITSLTPTQALLNPPAAQPELEDDTEEEPIEETATEPELAEILADTGKPLTKRDAMGVLVLCALLANDGPLESTDGHISGDLIALFDLPMVNTTRTALSQALLALEGRSVIKRDRLPFPPHATTRIELTRALSAAEIAALERGHPEAVRVVMKAITPTESDPETTPEEDTITSDTATAPTQPANGPGQPSETELERVFTLCQELQKLLWQATALLPATGHHVYPLRVKQLLVKAGWAKGAADEGRYYLRELGLARGLSKVGDAEGNWHWLVKPDRVQLDGVAKVIRERPHIPGLHRYEPDDYLGPGQVGPVRTRNANDLPPVSLLEAMEGHVLLALRIAGGAIDDPEASQSPLLAGLEAAGVIDRQPDEVSDCPIKLLIKLEPDDCTALKAMDDLYMKVIQGGEDRQPLASQAYAREKAQAVVWRLMDTAARQPRPEPVAPPVPVVDPPAPPVTPVAPVPKPMPLPVPPAQQQPDPAPPKPTAQQTLGKLQGLFKQLEELTKDLLDMKRKLAERDVYIAELETTKTELEAAKATLEAAQTSLEAEVRRLTAENEELKTKSADSGLSVIERALADYEARQAAQSSDS